MTNLCQYYMLYFPGHGEILRQGGRRRNSVHKENSWWLHINGHRNNGKRNCRGHD